MEVVSGLGNTGSWVFDDSRSLFWIPDSLRIFCLKRTWRIFRREEQDEQEEFQEKQKELQDDHEKQLRRLDRLRQFGLNAHLSLNVRSDKNACWT